MHPRFVEVNISVLGVFYSTVLPAQIGPSADLENAGQDDMMNSLNKFKYQPYWQWRIQSV